LKALIDHGLYDLFPPFKDKGAKQLLWNQVQNLRRTFQSNPSAVTTEEINRAKTIATSCFSDKLAREMMPFALLSLKPRFQDDRRVLEEFRHVSSGQKDCSTLTVVGPANI